MEKLRNLERFSLDPERRNALQIGTRLSRFSDLPKWYACLWMPCDSRWCQMDRCRLQRGPKHVQRNARDNWPPILGSVIMNQSYVQDFSNVEKFAADHEITCDYAMQEFGIEPVIVYNPPIFRRSSILNDFWPLKKRPFGLSFFSLFYSFNSGIISTGT